MAARSSTPAPRRGFRWRQLTDPDGELLVADILAVVAGCAVLRCERPGAWGEWRLCALPLAGGAVVELFRTPSQITSVAACDGRLFWALANGALGAVNLAGFPRPVPVCLPPNPWRASAAHAAAADAPPPTEDTAPPRGSAVLAALRGACSAPPVPVGEADGPPWRAWPLLALMRYRRQMLALVPHLPPVITEVDAPLVGRRGVVTCYTWSAAVRARGASYDQLVFRGPARRAPAAGRSIRPSSTRTRSRAGSSAAAGRLRSACGAGCPTCRSWPTC